MTGYAKPNACKSVLSYMVCASIFHSRADAFFPPLFQSQVVHSLTLSLLLSCPQIVTARILTSQLPCFVGELSKKALSNYWRLPRSRLLNITAQLSSCMFYAAQDLHLKFCQHKNPLKFCRSCSDRTELV